MRIDPQFVDVDFEKESLRLGLSRGCEGFLRPGQRFRSFADMANIIPQSQWEDLAIQGDTEKTNGAYLVTRVMDQTQEGSCVGNATAQCIECTQSASFGKENKIDISAISIYKSIGSSPQSGAYVGDALEFICDNGALPLDTPANREKFGDAVMPHTGFRAPYPTGWEETAKHFKGEEFVEINKAEEMFSSLLQRFFVVVGREGHSILYVAVVRKDGQWLFPYVNSWGNWGQAYGNMEYGFGFDTERQMKKTLGRSAGAFALRSMVYPTFAGAE